MITNGEGGAVRHGNFTNYYEFNSAEERLKLLPNNVWTNCTEKHENSPYLVLDVGCNSGVLTQLLWQYLSNCTGRNVYILGIDMDSTLIERAVTQNKHPQYVRYSTLDVMEESAEHNINEYLQSHKRKKFDAICCFAVTMWIHINHHDIGLKNFLQNLSKLTELFVVEPQPWKCYQTAERRLKKIKNQTFPLFLELKWRTHIEQEIENFIVANLGRQKVYESSLTKWRRKICFYR
ncbi:probable RNA methyltransferase CG11342 [Teleopsis dalmanni]|uniref:probable RNA methyltransferase CG11342 n=1 Tax=Teleopsis dalmanni TaxID=139649 RepID=UPI000D32AA89|nr:probable RNA methyltransferase CG11342 [Teleopsis dalmanni]XP_037938906.1 probable RNA methyltransferase CG11342 [Teleopsis dalmanni]XP_037939213.1 probable RNA methyltransferase CG11342 [Teleopsis dalmanni]